MTAPAWQPGTLYAPGRIVRPRSVPPVINATIPNADFEDGDTDWIKNGVTIVNDPANAYSGSWVARRGYTGGSSAGIRIDEVWPVRPGQAITASCFIRCEGGNDQIGGTIRMIWLDADMNGIGDGAPGNTIAVNQGTDWRRSTVNATAPANAAFVTFQADSYNLRTSGVVWFDRFTWNYNYSAPGAGLLYKAVQPAAGRSASTEPAWPPVLGEQVVDNEVIWEAVQMNRVVWQATPIMKTGATEPTWPLSPGGSVLDNTVNWRTSTAHVDDPKCPNGKVVVIAEGKIFSPDDDIVPYSATQRPLDWSSPRDAGFLPTNLQKGGSNPIVVANLYRGNMVYMSSEGFQMWQADPDPLGITRLDEIPGIGSTFNKAAQPVMNDLFILTSQGVRTVGIAAGSTNLQADEVGKPIDPLVVPKIKMSDDPLGFFFPGMGQYWLSFTPQLPEPSGIPLEYVYSGGVGGSGGGALRFGDDCGSDVLASAESVRILGYYTPLYSEGDAPVVACLALVDVDEFEYQELSEPYELQLWEAEDWWYVELGALGFWNEQDYYALISVDNGPPQLALINQAFGF